MAERGGVYFPARASLCNDQVARQIRRRYGHRGFDAYITLLCLLLREEGGRLSLSMESDWEDLADQLYGMEIQELKEFVAVLAHYGAVVHEDGILFSPMVSEAIGTYATAKEAAVRRGKASGEARRKKAEERKSESVS